MPFKKGQSGNPGGRPKRDWTWASLYEEELQKELTATDGTKIDAREAVARRLVKMAVEGDMQAIKELTQRMDGMPQQSLEHSGSIDLPTPILGSTVKDVYPDDSTT